MDEEYIYLSHYYNNATPGYGGDKEIEITSRRCISNGDKCNKLQIVMSNHAGTHIDLPFHFDQNGRRLNDYTAREWFFSKIAIVEIPLEPNELLTADKLQDNLNPDIEFLIIKTFFQKYRTSDNYWKANPGLHHKLANYFRDRFKNLKIIGFDFLSATSFQNKEEGRLAHLSFLHKDHGNPILLIEDMNLEYLNLNSRISWIHVSPLLIEDADGVPVTITAALK